MNEGSHMCQDQEEEGKNKHEQNEELKEIARNSSSNSLITENNGLAIATPLLLLLL